ncbi:MAG: hypothetical protein Q8L54_03335 [Devosia sp.]|nr:hypothetical protein [Devosia sp.]
MPSFIRTTCGVGYAPIHPHAINRDWVMRPSERIACRTSENRSGQVTTT